MTFMTSKNGSNSNLDSQNLSSISKAKSDFQLCDESHPVVEITKIIGSKDDIETAEEDHDNGENDREDAEQKEEGKGNQRSPKVSRSNKPYNPCQHKNKTSYDSFSIRPFIPENK